jgi:putative ATP-binding cassette transporter
LKGDGGWELMDASGYEFDKPAADAPAPAPAPARPVAASFVG